MILIWLHEKFAEEEYSQALLYYNDYLTRESQEGSKAESALYGIIKCLAYTNNKCSTYHQKSREYQAKYPEGIYIEEVSDIANQIETKDTERKVKQAETEKNWETRYEELKKRH